MVGVVFAVLRVLVLQLLRMPVSFSRTLVAIHLQVYVRLG